MTRIVHISDVHFGRSRPELLDPLVDTINAADPAIVVLSGDLTQRAKGWQFAEARGFLNRIKAPWICVPGNHDIPLHNPFLRLLRPFGGYKKRISNNLEPGHDLGDVRIVGLNTATPYLWQRGWIRRRTVQRACERLAAGTQRRFNIIVAHHPFSHGEGSTKDLMRGAERGIHALADCGANIILSGHLHTWQTAPFLMRDGTARVLQVHAGTGISTRVRGEPNDFALLDFNRDGLLITRFAAASEPLFQPVSEVGFYYRGGIWEEKLPQSAASLRQRRPVR